MFKWMTEIDKPPIGFNNEIGKLSIERMNSTIELNEMSPVCQFFASFDVVIDDHSQAYLPTPNDAALEILLNEIVPHYIDVKQLFINGKLNQISVRELKKESKKIVKGLLSKGVCPVIPDLYHTKHLDFANEPRKLNYYLVNQELINPLHLEEIEKVWKFFSNSFFVESGSIMLQPTGWKLDDHLKESVTIRAFSPFAKQIILVVDKKDLSVIGLDIYG